MAQGPTKRLATGHALTAGYKDVLLYKLQKVSSIIDDCNARNDTCRLDFCVSFTSCSSI